MILSLILSSPSSICAVLCFQRADENLHFEDQILEAARSIAAATAALVKSASAAQRELVAQGIVGSTYTQHSVDDDGQWSQGLISAVSVCFFVWN